MDGKELDTMLMKILSVPELLLTVFGHTHSCIHERLDQQWLDGVVEDNYCHQVTTLARYVDQLIVLKHLLLYCRQLLLIHVPLTASSQSPTDHDIHPATQMFGRKSNR